jgi:hypothetical protein
MDIKTRHADSPYLLFFSSRTRFYKRKREINSSIHPLAVSFNRLAQIPIRNAEEQGSPIPLIDIPGPKKKKASLWKNAVKNKTCRFSICHSKADL